MPKHDFGDLKAAKGQKKLNQYLEDKSYIEGYSVSNADYDVFEQLGTAPPPSFPHVLRWYRHIASYERIQPKALTGTPVTNNKPVKKEVKADNDDDVDLFGSDDEEQNAEADRIREERLQAYNAKKSKKPELIAKSSVVLDVKPWDDETDMKAMEQKVRNIQMDGLVWGASKLVPVGYGINKLQIMSVVEDAKVSVDELTEKIESIEELVQSVDIAAFNKI